MITQQMTLPTTSNQLLHLAAMNLYSDNDGSGAGNDSDSP